jgi:hypothetical protein
MSERNTTRDAAMYQMMLRTGMIREMENDQEVRVQIHQNAGASGGLLKRSIPADDAIPRATVAAALVELRAGYTQRADGKGASIPWRAATDLARQELDATITALDLTADVFDAAIASRPDVLERLADEAVKEKQ